MAIKPNLAGLQQAKRYASYGQIDRGAAEGEVARASANQHKFAAIDDSKPDSDPSHFHHPIINGDRVNVAMVRKAIADRQAAGDHETAAHLQTVMDECDRHSPRSGMYSRGLIIGNPDHAFAASRVATSEETKNLPSQVNGKSVTYRWKESVPIDRDIVDRDGIVHRYSKPRMEKAAATFSRAVSNGFVAPLPENHRIPPEDGQLNAGFKGKCYGYMVDASIAPSSKNDGSQSVYTLCQLFEDTLPEALSKFSSIYIRPSYTDDKGNSYEDLFDHNAIIPDPTIGGLGEFVKSLAASRGSSYDPIPDIAEFSNGASIMDLTKIKALLGDAAKGLTDSQLEKMILDKLNTGSADATALAASRSQVDQLIKEKDALAASRGMPVAPSDNERQSLGYAIEAKAEVIDSAKTGISPATIQAIKGLFIKDGKAAGFAASRNDGDTDPVSIKLINILAKNEVPPALGSKTEAVAFSRITEVADYKKLEEEGRKQGEKARDESLKRNQG